MMLTILSPQVSQWSWLRSAISGPGSGPAAPAWPGQAHQGGAGAGDVAPGSADPSWEPTEQPQLHPAHPQKAGTQAGRGRWKIGSGNEYHSEKD